jgi:hypothetical protein
MFPTGLPGVALLLLRVSVGSAAVISTHVSSSSGWLQSSAILVAVGLFAGYLTPLVAVAAIVVQAFAWLGPAPEPTIWAAIVFLDAIALGLVGPGAYSLDAYLFGRRVVVLPPS